MPLEIHAISDAGHVRDHNEDMFLVGHHQGREEPYGIVHDGASPLLLAVADGMGGHARGEIASRRVLEMLGEARVQGLLPARAADHRNFASILTDIHDRLVGEQDPGTGSLPMGSTLVGAWFPPTGEMVRFHAGDSRLYRLRNARLQQLTEDHTIRNQMLRSGADPGNVSPHLITSCLGGGVGQPTVDTAVEPSLQPGDRYLLCSDGLTDMVPDDKIKELLAAGDSRLAATALVEAALQAGGRDNVTVVVAVVTAG